MQDPIKSPRLVTLKESREPAASLTASPFKNNNLAFLIIRPARQLQCLMSQIHLSTHKIASLEALAAAPPRLAVASSVRSHFPSNRHK